MNAHMMSKLHYVLPIMSQLSEKQAQKVHKLVMYAARSVMGSYCFKMSVNSILNQVGWLPAYKLIKWSAVKLIHKILYNQSPGSLFKLFKVNPRSCARVYPYKIPKSKIAKNFFLYKQLEIYNNLPSDIKSRPPHIFKIKGKRYLRSNFTVS